MDFLLDLVREMQTSAEEEELLAGKGRYLGVLGGCLLCRFTTERLRSR